MVVVFALHSNYSYEPCLCKIVDFGVPGISRTVFLREGLYHPSSPTKFEIHDLASMLGCLKNQSRASGVYIHVRDWTPQFLLATQFLDTLWVVGHVVCVYVLTLTCNLLHVVCLTVVKKRSIGCSDLAGEMY